VLHPQQGSHAAALHPQEDADGHKSAMKALHGHARMGGSMHDADALHASTDCAIGKGVQLDAQQDWQQLLEAGDCSSFETELAGASACYTEASAARFDTPDTQEPIMAASPSEHSFACWDSGRDSLLDEACMGVYKAERAGTSTSGLEEAHCDTAQDLESIIGACRREQLHRNRSECRSSIPDLGCESDQHVSVCTSTLSELIHEAEKGSCGRAHSESVLDDLSETECLSPMRFSQQLLAMACPTFDIDAIMTELDAELSTEQLRVIEDFMQPTGPVRTGQDMFQYYMQRGRGAQVAS
jgi:hypothetical protein